VRFQGLIGALSLVLMGVLVLARVSTAAAFDMSRAGATFPALTGQVQVIQTPNENGHPEFENAINQAQSSIVMTMYHLTDQAVMQDLGAAVKRGINVRVIVDGESVKAAGYEAAFKELQDQGVAVRASSPMFSITHEKSLIVDNSLAFVTAINLTRSGLNSRDFGIITQDPSVIAEMNSVFETDWSNAETGNGDTPTLSNPNLAWSPTNSTAQILALIQTAQSTIIATSENLGDSDVMSGLTAAAARGVAVRVLVPQCDLNSNPAFNIPFVRQLSAAGVNAHIMPGPSTPELPYIHSKMMIVDGNEVFVGSINFSYNSMTKARELGIIFADSQSANFISSVFENDWSQSVEAPAVDVTCPTFGANNGPANGKAGLF